MRALDKQINARKEEGAASNDESSRLRAWGTAEANEAIKTILNIGDLFTNKILYVDLLQNTLNFIDVYRDENCIACGKEAQDLTESYNYRIEDICQ